MDSYKLLIFLIITITGSPFNDKRSAELHKKINKLLNRTQDNEIFLDIDQVEYPRLNKTFKQAHQEQWLDYYKCLKDRYKEINSERTFYPIALMALEGTSVTLKCQICISPMIDLKSDSSIEWYFNSSKAKTIVNNLVENTEHVLISPDDASLIIHNVQMSQDGQYWCRLHDTIESPYYLQIENDATMIKIVHPKTAPKGPHSTPSQTISNYNLNVDTEWTDWSPCSVCDTVGKKQRYGYCVISILTDNSRKRRNGKDTSTQNRTIEKNESKLYSILSIFNNKLPCQFKLLPRFVREMMEIKNRTSEIMRAYCKKKCVKNIVYEIRDEKGNVIESANNSAGIYSMLQGVPKQSLSVVRTTIYRKHDSRTELVCPGNSNTDSPILWKIGNQSIVSSLMEKQSNGRIFIDSKSYIVIKKLRFADENFYSCWQNDELTGIIKLKVTEDPELSVNSNAMLIGAIAIVIVFIKVFWRAFQGRKRYTKR